MPSGAQDRTGLGDDMDCGWIRQHVERILDGGYSPEVRGQLAEHLRVCSDCGQVLRAAEEEERVLQAALPPTDAPRDLTPEIMASLPRARRQSRGPGRIALLFRLALPVAGVAATVAIAFALRFWAGRGEGGDPPAVAQHRETGSPHGAVAQGDVPVVATLRVPSGTVKLLSDGGGSRSAEAGMALRVDAVLRTTADSSAELDFGGKVRVRLDSDSRARVTSSSGILLVSGRLFVWVEEKGTRFSVATPQAEAEVRGTEFCVDSRTEGRTVLTVVEGVVVFRNEHGTVEVQAGLQSHAEAGTGPVTGRPVDVSGIVAWVGSTGKEPGRGIDVRLWVRLDEVDGSRVSGTPPTFVVELDYPESAYAPLWVSCEITDTEGRAVSERSVQASSTSDRYRVRKMVFAELGPGRYRAGFRIVGRDEESAKRLEFEVR